MKKTAIKLYLAFKKRTKLRQWKIKNSHNHTEYGEIRFLDCVSIGKGTYGKISSDFTRDIAKLKIGNYCSIANNVRFIACADHNLNTVSTYPYHAMFMGKDIDAISKGNIIVDDDVWIGYNATILSGVHIGQGAVIAAGAVVTSDVPPYAIAGGVPAKVIKYRFEQPVINFLLTLDYNRLDKELIEAHIDELYKPIGDVALDEIKRLYGWFPKKKD